MISWKKTMSALLCGAMLFGCAVYAEGEGETGAETPVTPEKAVVSIAADKTEVRVGEKFKITVTVDNLQDNLKTADITLGADTDGVFTFEGSVKITNETPSKDKITKEVEVTTADAALTEARTVKFSVNTVSLKNEADAEMDYTKGDDITVTVKNSVAYSAKLKFDTELSGTEGIAVAFVKDETETPAILELDATDKKIVNVGLDAALAEGTYNVKITADGCKLPEDFTVEITAENARPAFEKELTAAGYNDDNKIDIFDFHAICRAVNAAATDTKYDLNRDGKVNKSDIAAIVSLWTASLK